MPYYMLFMLFIALSVFVFGSLFFASIIVSITPNKKNDLYSGLQACVEKGECEITNSKIHIWRERLMWYFMKDGGRIKTFVGIYIGIILTGFVELPYDCFKAVWEAFSKKTA